MNINGRQIEILLVEDSPGDIRLTQEALADAKIHNRMSVVNDGIQALEFLCNEGDNPDAPRPDLILMDLNMPRMDGRECLEKIKADEKLKSIPVVILTTSEAERDIAQSYQLQANCYISKPVDLDQFIEVVAAIEQFWFSIVKLPPRAA